MPVDFAENDSSTNRAMTAAVTVGDLTSTARGSGARKSANKPQWCQFPFWTVVPLVNLFRDVFVPSDNDGVRYMAHVLLDDMALWQRGNDQSLDWVAAKVLAILSHLEGQERANLRGLLPVIRVLEFGAKKYAVGNWTRGMAWSVVFTSAMSHLTKVQAGETVDDESGESHFAHFACNVFFLLAYRDIFPEGDDRLPGFRPGGVPKTNVEVS